jgi:hypothetical protein
MPIDLILALDVSGSMDGSKLDSLKKSVMQLLDCMNDNDRLAIFTFSDKAYILFDLQPVGGLKDYIIYSINSLQAEGGTDILNPILCFNSKLPSLRKEACKIGLIFTDGFDNLAQIELLDPSLVDAPMQNDVVTYNQQQVVRRQNRIAQILTQVKQWSTFQFQCFCMGCGPEQDASLLRAMANETSGSYYNADVSNLRDILGLFFNRALNVVAHNISLTIELNPLHARVGFLKNMPWRILANDTFMINPNSYITRTNVLIGSLSYKEMKDLPFYIALNDGVQQTEVNLIVTYQAFQNGPIVEQLFCKLVLKPTPPSEDVDEQFNRVYGALAIMEAAQQGAEVDKPTAYGTLRAVSDFIGQSLSSQRPQSKSVKADIDALGQMMAQHPERPKLTNDEFRNMIATGEKHIKQEKRSVNDEEYQNDDKKMNHRNSMANLMAATQRLTSRLDDFVKKAETLKEREDRELTKLDEETVNQKLPYPAALKHPNMFQMTQSTLQNQINALRSVKKGPPPVLPKQEPTNQFQLPQLRPVERTNSGGLSSRPKSMSVSSPNFKIPVSPPKGVVKTPGSLNGSQGPNSTGGVPNASPSKLSPVRPKSTMLTKPVEGLTPLPGPKQPVVGAVPKKVVEKQRLESEFKVKLEQEKKRLEEEFKLRMEEMQRKLEEEFKLKMSMLENNAL